VPRFRSGGASYSRASFTSRLVSSQFVGRWQSTALTAVDAVGERVETPGFLMVAEQFQHLDGQFRTRAVDAAVHGGALRVQVQTEQDRQAVVMPSAEGEFDDHAERCSISPPSRERIVEITSLFG
jgi:hypothetical protein